MHHNDAYPFNTILQWNCRSLYDKRFELINIIGIAKPLAICLQETYSITDKDMLEIKNLFKNFIFYFKCRERNGQHNPGGGVAIMIHKDVPHSHKLINTSLEAIVVDIKFRSKQISICSLYLSPSKNFTTQSLKDMSDQLLDHHVIVGDFNAHNITWLPCILITRVLWYQTL